MTLESHYIDRPPRYTRWVFVSFVRGRHWLSIVRADDLETCKNSRDTSRVVCGIFRTIARPHFLFRNFVFFGRDVATSPSEAREKLSEEFDDNYPRAT